ncbi:hypothetical protein SAMN05892877_109180 [Rhizobium subbaraonis]|uniref:Uncharacterized protein n=1 Tax=Rhizobium subbaraonis TaxID=908946 RepID=A0A285UJF1_9HYPH|nr:hypothetical protein [Rhizobium subbaraonis]SOC42020.1 hypothetical protein SAMN05892877_109180 [Rhizobium subbaraonis]
MATDWLEGNEPDADWDLEFAEELLGSLVLLGLTYREPDGTVAEQRQHHGYVKTVDPRWGITVKLEGDEAENEINLPPILDAFERAEEGVYTDSSGNGVSDPDFIGYFTVRSAAN